MKLRASWAPFFLIFLAALAEDEYGDATYTLIHHHSARRLSAPTPLDLIEGVIEHSMGVLNSKALFKFKGSFCSYSKDCLDPVLLSNPSSSHSIYAFKLNEDDVNDLLPPIYEPYIPAFSALAAPLPPKSESIPQNDPMLAPDRIVIENNDGFSIPLFSGKGNNKHVSGLPSASDNSFSSTYEEIRREQEKHINSFYLKQVSARYINWCYTNNYANLIYPFLPDDVAENPLLMKKSLCHNLIHRNIFLILRYTNNRLTEEFALNLIFSYPLFVYLKELSSYLDTAFKALHKIIISKKGGVSEWEEQRTTKLNKAVRIKKKKYAKLPKPATLDGEQLGKDSITDTILLGCQALFKVPYYFNQDPKKQIFQPNIVRTNTVFINTSSSGNTINQGTLSTAIARCDAVIPGIIKNYSNREERKIYREFYENKEKDKFDGRQITFPNIPIDLNELRQLSILEEEATGKCNKDESRIALTSELLYCLESLSSKFSLMLGMIASNLYLALPDYTKKVVIVLERLQALQLVAIHVKHTEEEMRRGRENNLTIVNKDSERLDFEEDIMENKGFLENPSLYAIIEDVNQQIRSFLSDLKVSFTEIMDQNVVSTLETKNYFHASKAKYRALRNQIRKLSLEDIYNLIHEREGIINQRSVEKVIEGHFRTKPSKQQLNVQRIEEKNPALENEDETVENVALSIKGEAESESQSLFMEEQNEEERNQEISSSESGDLPLYIEESQDSKPDSKKTATEFILKDIVMDPRVSVKFILENLLLQLNASPLALCYNDVYQPAENLKEKNQGTISYKNLLDTYDCVNAFYQWSLPTAYFLKKKYIPLSIASYPWKHGLARATFSFPGDVKHQTWMPWSQSYLSKLRSTVFNKHSWSRFFPGVNKKKLPLYYRNTINRIMASKQNEETKENYIEKNNEIAQDNFDIVNFACEFLKAFSILSPTSYISPFSHYASFSKSTSELITLIEYYEKVMLQSDVQAMDEFIKIMKKKGKVPKDNKNKKRRSVNKKKAEIADIPTTAEIESNYLSKPNVLDISVQTVPPPTFYSSSINHTKHPSDISSYYFGLQSNIINAVRPTNHQALLPPQTLINPLYLYNGMARTVQAPLQSTVNTLPISTWLPYSFLFQPNQTSPLHNPYYHISKPSLLFNSNNLQTPVAPYEINRIQFPSEIFNQASILHHMNSFLSEDISIEKEKEEKVLRVEEKIPEQINKKRPPPKTRLELEPENTKYQK